MMSIDNLFFNTDKTIVIVGAGKRCAIICDFMSKQNVNNVVIIDNNPSKWGKTIGDYTICQ